MKYIASVAAICFVINNLQAMEPSSNDNNTNGQSSHLSFLDESVPTLASIVASAFEPMGDDVIHGRSSLGEVPVLGHNFGQSSGMSVDMRTAMYNTYTSGNQLRPSFAPQQTIIEPRLQYRSGMSESYLTTIRRSLPSAESNTAVGTRSLQEITSPRLSGGITIRSRHLFDFYMNYDEPLSGYWDRQNGESLSGMFPPSLTKQTSSCIKIGIIPPLIINDSSIPCKKEKYTFKNPAQHDMYSLCFSADGKMACDGADKNYNLSLFIGNRSDGIFEQLPDNCKKCYNKLIFNKDGSILCAKALTFEMYLWNTHTKSLINPQNYQHKSVNAFDTSPTDAHLLVSSFNNTINIWDLTIGKMIIKTKYGCDDHCNMIHYAPSGTSVATQRKSFLDAPNGFLSLCDIRSLNSTIVYQYKYSNLHPQSAFSPNEQLLATVDEREIHIIDLRMNKPVQNSIPSGDMCQSIFFVGTKLFGVGKFKNKLINYDTVTNELQQSNIGTFHSSTWHKWTQELSFESSEGYEIYNFAGISHRAKPCSTNITQLELAKSLLYSQFVEIKNFVRKKYKNDETILNQIALNEKKLRSDLDQMSNKEIKENLDDSILFSEKMRQTLLQDLPSCPICLEVYQDLIKYWGKAGSQVTTPCGHTFCDVCYSKIGLKCPLCRQPI